MSLQKCPHCHQKITLWESYKRLNKAGKFGKVMCPHCTKPLEIETKRNRWVGGILIMLPVCIVLFLVGFQKLSALEAIILMILYHIILMIWIIKWYNYKK